MTSDLLQKLFAELDPHKKTYLTLKDWESCFKLFDQKAHLIIDFKNFIQFYFADVKSAYAYYAQYGVGGQVKT